MVRQDVYWQFAELTDYRYLDPEVNHPNWYLQLLVELCDGKTAQHLHDWLQTNTLSSSRAAQIPSGFVVQYYREGGVFSALNQATSTRRLSYVTAWVAKGQIAHLPASIVKRFKLGLPFRQRLDPPEKSHESIEKQDKKVGWSFTSDMKNKETIFVGVIDDFINANTVAKGRVKAYWDQNSDLKRPRTPYFGYGLLRKADVFQPAVSHGTLVASIAAGEVTPQYRSRQNLSETTKYDHASKMPLMAVQLRQDTVADTSGGALAVNVLDGLHFMLANLPPEAKLAVNISFGTMAGAHDGTGILESAMQELTHLMGGRLEIVLPAGNSRQAQAHAQIVVKQGLDKDLKWRVSPDDQTPSYVEIWTDPSANFDVKLTSPDMRSSISCSNGRTRSTMTHGGSVIAALIPNTRPASSTNKQVILVALAPTQTKHAPNAAHGDWTIQVTNTGQTDAVFDCWIERDNASFGQKSKGRQSYFVEPNWPRRPHALLTALPPSSIKEGNTLNGIATGLSVKVVGGYRLSDDALASYSGEGGSGVRSPNGVAPSDESVMLRGIAGLTNSGASVARLSGTSAAAPWVTRGIVNAWAGTPNRTSPPDARPGSHNAGSPTRSGNTTWT